MFVTFFPVFYVLFGSSCGLQNKKVCYGSNIDIHFRSFSMNNKLYFYPREGERKLLMDNREAKDPRLQVYSNSVKLTQLTEKDNGKFAIEMFRGEISHLFSMTILDCSEDISLFYGKELVRIVPSRAELLEFTPFHIIQPRLLWERANPHNNYGGRGKVSGDVFKISKVTQEDNGYYNFRHKNKSVVLRLKLTVEEDTNYYDFEESEDIFLQFPWASRDWTVTFKPYYNDDEEIAIIKAGSVVRSKNPFYHKIEIKDSGINICCITNGDAGTFKFRDPAGNLALVSRVQINEIHRSTKDSTTDIFTVFIILAVIVAVLGVLCCCCYCCKKGCCEKTEPLSPVAQTATEPKVYYHGLNKPKGSEFSAPPYHAAFPPPAVNAGMSDDAAAASSGPVEYQTTYEDTNISQPEVAPPASEQFAPSSSSGYNPVSSDYQPVFETHYPTFEIRNISPPEVTAGASQQSAPSSSSGYNPVSSDYQPMFEVKGLNSTFDLPLTTENSSTDVYNSDKMNFL